MASSEQTLSVFFRRCVAPAPAFEYTTCTNEAKQTVHQCTITTSECQWEGQVPVPAIAESAQSKKRKSSQHLAAQAALHVLKGTAAFAAFTASQPVRVSESLLQTLMTMLSDQVCHVLMI